MARQIVLDTETTGLDPKAGHRIVEVAALELMNYLPSGAVFHKYVNPERDMPQEAFDVHGLSEAFLSDKPLFSTIAQDFLDFIGEDELIIHNARFDVGFLNAELGRLSLNPIPMEQARDTVAIARKKFPGSQVSLDALCRRFGIDNSARTLHGALLDCELLAEVYLELIGGRQPELLGAAQQSGTAATAHGQNMPNAAKAVRPPRRFSLSAEEECAHAEMLKDLKEPIWLKA